MRRALGSAGWPVAFLLTAALVCAVLGWVTVAALRVEAAQREAAARAELGNNLRVALWRLDGRMLPALGVEDSRPFHHYTTADPLQGSIAGPTPLLAAPLPDWMKLHAQLDPVVGWESPQVLSPEATTRVNDAWPDLPLRNNTDERAGVLKDVRTRHPAAGAWAALCAHDSAAPTDNRPFAAPLFDPLPSAEPDAPSPPASASSKPPPPELDAVQIAATSEKAVEPFRLLGYEFGCPDENRITAQAKKESAAPWGNPPAQPAPNPQIQQQQQLANGQRGGRSADNERQLNDFRNRSDVIARGVQDGKNAAQDPYAGKNYAQNGIFVGNDNRGPGVFNVVQNPGVPGPGPGPIGNLDKDAQGRIALEQRDNNNDRARDLLKKLQAEQFPDMPGAVPRPVSPGEDRPPPNTMMGNVLGNTFNFAPPPVISIHLGSMRPHWIAAADGSETLVLARAAKLDDRTVYQCVVLDWPKLQQVLKEQVGDLFPEARLVPVKDATEVSPDRAMTALPVQLDPGAASELPPAGWTPLRIGLALAWVAALIAFAAVGFSGWSLLDLAERRIRFVSAVTHELRTPLTSLRLYLDLLMSGMIHDEAKRQEYLNTLATESDRLHRLIDNVLDFAKLEKRARNGDLKSVAVSELAEQLRATWAERVAADGKELVVVSTLPADATVCTDAAMVGQIVGNLIDNARKYTRDATDARIWLWVKPGGSGRVVFEVEDRGAGVAANERKTIFKPFRRGENADTTAGGAGLGLALAKQWAEVLGGTLTYRPAEGAPGACFRLELPAK